MNPWIAKAVILAASIVLVAIRAPHGQRSSAVKIVKDRKVRLEVALLVLAMLGPELQRTFWSPTGPIFVTRSTFTGSTMVSRRQTRP